MRNKTTDILTVNVIHRKLCVVMNIEVKSNFCAIEKKQKDKINQKSKRLKMIQIKIKIIRISGKRKKLYVNRNKLLVYTEH